ncbi:MAG: helix-turn-helix domain-containing protein [Thermoplasmatales archaeon]
MKSDSHVRDRIVEILFSGQMSQREITSVSHASRSRVSEVLKDLELKGFVRRHRVGGRTVYVSLDPDKTLRIGILRSSEYFHVVAAMLALEKELLVRIKVYDNSLEALKNLLLGAEDLVTSPLVSGYFFHLIDGNVKPLAAVARGGSGIIFKRDSGLIGTTPLSSMDRESMKAERYRRAYFRSVEEILKAYRDDQIDAASIWEPFLSMEGGISAKPEDVCCCIFSNKATSKAMKEFLNSYFLSLREGADCKERRVVCSSLASILGVRISDVEKSLKSYEFTNEMDRKDAIDQISRFGFPVEKGVDLFLEKCPTVSV